VRKIHKPQQPISSNLISPTKSRRNPSLVGVIPFIFTPKISSLATLCDQLLNFRDFLTAMLSTVSSCKKRLYLNISVERRAVATVRGPLLTRGEERQFCRRQSEIDYSAANSTVINSHWVRRQAGNTVNSRRWEDAILSSLYKTILLSALLSPC